MNTANDSSEHEESPLVQPKTTIPSASPASQQYSRKYIVCLSIVGAVSMAFAILMGFSGFRIELDPRLTDGHLAHFRSTKNPSDPRGYPSSFPILQWKKPACQDSPYDFVGSIQFCQTKINHERRFGYRLDKSQPCGVGPNPLIRMKPGYSYQLRLENDSKYPTNIHPHGLHISGDGNSDDIDRIATEKGSCLFYNWTLSHDHPDGTFWYHAHAHTYSKMQLSRGAYGMLIVDPPDGYIPEPNRPSFLENQERILLIGTTRLSKTEWYHTANGLELGQKGTVDIPTQQWTRLRVMVADSNAIMRNVLFDDSVCKTRMLAHDGIWKSTVPGPERSVFQLSGASRMDIAIMCSASSWIWYDTEDRNGTPFVNLHVADDVARDQLDKNDIWKKWNPKRPRYLTSLVEKPGAKRYFNITMTAIYLNGVVFDAGRPLDQFEFGAVHEWSIYNSSWHPFHLHT